MQIARYFAVGVEQAPDGEFVAGKCDEVLSALFGCEESPLARSPEWRRRRL